jgi:hypothetical protein
MILAYLLIGKTMQVNTYVCFLALTLLFSSCSLFRKKKLEVKAHPNNTVIKQNLPTFIKVDLAAEGYIGLGQKFKSYSFCSAMRPEMQVIITPFDKTNHFEVKTNCSKKLKTYRVSSKNILPIGSYRVKLNFEHEAKAMLGHPRLHVRYKNPDFASDDDHLSEGAKAWAPNQKLQETVDPSKGDKNDWYKIDTGDSSARLTLLDKSKGNIVANLVWLSATTGRVAKKRRMRSGKKRIVTVGDNQELYLHVFGKTYTPSSSYTVFRKDLAKSIVTSIPLIDFYPVSSNQWNGLLKKVDGVEAGSIIRIKAKNGSSYRVLGNCAVSSISGDVATCTISRSSSKSYPSYRAEMVKKPE